MNLERKQRLGFVNLKVAAAEEEVDFGVVNLFDVLEGSVDVVEVTVHTTFYCNFHFDAQIKSESQGAVLPINK
jgi:hypothetical protein